MKRTRLLRPLALVALVVAVLSLGAGQVDKKAPPAEVSEAERLVEQLSNQRYLEREEAGRKLLQMEDQAIPALLKATKAPDDEMRRRAAKLLDTLSKRLNNWSTPKSLADLEREGLSNFLKRMVAEEGFADKQGWGKVRQLTSRVAAWAGVQFYLSYPDGTLGLAFQELEPAELTTRHDCPQSGCRRCKIVIQGLTQPVKELDHCILISAGPLEHPIQSISDSIVIVDGIFKGASEVKNSLVLSKGKMGTFGAVKSSILITAGTIDELRGLDNSALVFSNKVGRIRQTLRKSIFLNKGDGGPEDGGLEYWPPYSESLTQIGILTGPAQLFHIAEAKRAIGKAAKSKK